MDERTALPLLRSTFEAVTGLVVQDWEEQPQLRGSHTRPDVRLVASGTPFIAEYKAAATTEQIGAAAHLLSAAAEPGTVPLLVVPYMGEVGRQMCRAVGVSWLDLSGNADISAPPVRIRILGEPNRFKRPGRPTTLFAPRSARVARVLLQHSEQTWLQGELADLSGLSRGFLSRLLPRYEEAGFVTREPLGRSARYRCVDPDGLLAAWRADYDFTGHTILRGHVASRTGPELLRELANSLSMQQIDYAATGLAAAWLWEPFAAFRTAAIYLASWPSPSLMAELGFHEGARGSNAWLVVPNDDGVFDGAVHLEGVRCVSAVQVYLDLKGQPERADEAAEELRRLHLTWPRTSQGVES
ncbi:MAG: hypothetical protein IT204_26300 [Fimbriimonadaceae bacterium]|nr:hypothetical protein [Fimbriimonadaceae bacterium]